MITGLQALSRMVAKCPFGFDPRRAHHHSVEFFDRAQFSQIPPAVQCVSASLPFFLILTMTRLVVPAVRVTEAEREAEPAVRLIGMS